MRVRNYAQLLKARGYKVVQHTDYQGVNIFVKKHKYNTVTCTVVKDTHGKGQSIDFAITSQISLDPVIKKEINFDADYLQKEVHMIGTSFMLLRDMTAPKHLVI